MDWAGDEGTSAACIAGGAELARAGEESLLGNSGVCALPDLIGPTGTAVSVAAGAEGSTGAEGSGGSGPAGSGAALARGSRGKGLRLLSGLCAAGLGIQTGGVDLLRLRGGRVWGKSPRRT